MARSDAAQLRDFSSGSPILCRKKQEPELEPLVLFLIFLTFACDAVPVSVPHPFTALLSFLLWPPPSTPQRTSTLSLSWRSWPGFSFRAALLCLVFSIQNSKDRGQFANQYSNGMRPLSPFSFISFLEPANAFIFLIPLYPFHPPTPLSKSRTNTSKTAAV